MSKRVLIVEDDHDIRVELRTTLETAGYSVFSAPHGQEALKLLETLPRPSMILLDILMPVMNGEEFLSCLQRDPKLRDIPVAQISAVRSQPVPGACIAFRKPLDTRKLIQVIEEYACA